MPAPCPHCGKERIVATSTTTGCCAGERAEQGYGPTAKGPKMKLSNRQILEISAALQTLAPKQPSSEGSKAKSIPWKVTYAAARTMAKLAGQVDAISRARTAIIAPHSDGRNGVPNDSPHFQQVQSEITELMDTRAEVRVHRIPIKSLEDCDLVPATLYQLMPILDGVEDEDEDEDG